MYRTNRQLLKEPSIQPSKLSAVSSGHLIKTYKACTDTDTDTDTYKFSKSELGKDK
jgi:hypothetical protein